MVAYSHTFGVFRKKNKRQQTMKGIIGLFWVLLCGQSLAQDSTDLDELNAAWRKCLAAGSNKSDTGQSFTDRETRCWFLGYLEAKIGIAPPAYWSSGLLNGTWRGKEGRRRLCFEIKIDDVPYRVIDGNMLATKDLIIGNNNGALQLAIDYDGDVEIVAKVGDVGIVREIKEASGCPIRC
jgi:hypothetical protein